VRDTASPVAVTQSANDVKNLEIVVIPHAWGKSSTTREPASNAPLTDANAGVGSFFGADGDFWFDRSLRK